MGGAGGAGGACSFRTLATILKGKGEEEDVLSLVAPLLLVHNKVTGGQANIWTDLWRGFTRS